MARVPFATKTAFGRRHPFMYGSALRIDRDKHQSIAVQLAERRAAAAAGGTQSA